MASRSKRKRARKETERKNSLILKAISSIERRRAIASSMIAPLRSRIDYQSVGRRTFSVDQLPEKCGQCGKPAGTGIKDGCRECIIHGVMEL
jgi:hypothetical protein